MYINDHNSYYQKKLSDDYLTMLILDRFLWSYMKETKTNLVLNECGIFYSKKHDYVYKYILLFFWFVHVFVGDITHVLIG